MVERTAAAELWSSARSPSVSSISMIASRPFLPSLQGTPKYWPLMPYSPSKYTEAGTMVFLSFSIEETMHFTLDAGANIHLLYPEASASTVYGFVERELVSFCQRGEHILDRVGTGASRL